MISCLEYYICNCDPGGDCTSNMTYVCYTCDIVQLKIDYAIIIIFWHNM